MMAAKTKAPKAAHTEPRKPLPLPTRQAILLELLPAHEWNISLAGPIAGYSKSYSETRLGPVLRRSVRFCRALEAKKAAIQAVVISKEEWDRRAEDLRERCKTANDRPTEAQVLKMQGQAIGRFELDHSERRPEGVAVVVFAPPGVSVATLPVVGAPKQIESTVIDAPKVGP